MLTYVSKKLSLVSEERGKVFRLGVKIVTNERKKLSPEMSNIYDIENPFIFHPPNCPTLIGVAYIN